MSASRSSNRKIIQEHAGKPSNASSTRTRPLPQASRSGIDSRPLSGVGDQVRIAWPVSPGMVTLIAAPITVCCSRWLMAWCAVSQDGGYAAVCRARWSSGGAIVNTIGGGGGTSLPLW